MYKNTFQMINGDISLDKDLIMVHEQEELRQSLENRLSINKDEWFLNLELGLQYKDIRGKRVSDIEIEMAIRECLFQDKRVSEVLNFNIIRDRVKRTAEIHFTIIDNSNNKLYLEEVVDIG